MKCPQCGHEQTCPCKPCKSRLPTEKPWKWVNGEMIACGNCGHIENVNWWEEQAMNEFRKNKNENS